MNLRRTQAAWVGLALLGGLMFALGSGAPSRSPAASTRLVVSREVDLPTLARYPTRTSAVHPIPTRPPTLTPLRPAQPTRTAFVVTAKHVDAQPDLAPPTSARPEPTAALPPYAEINGLSGDIQYLPLSCEARSAVDWAAYFGKSIYELEFFSLLPRSSNPEEGFVGDPYGSWGQVPPGPYGVHAAPVARLLRAYGIPARAERNLPLGALLAEIAADRPVIVWVTGHVEPGHGQPYNAGEQVVTVAPYEHTVIVFGYDDTRDVVMILDGAVVYERSFAVFQAAWSPLENMAIVWGTEEE